MTCGEVETKISSYLERNLDAATYAQIEVHLVDCARCNGLLYNVEDVVRVLGATQTIDPSKQLVPRILERTIGRKHSPLRAIAFGPRLRLSFFPKYAMGAVLGFFFFSFIVNVLGPRYVGLAYSEAANSSGQIIKTVDILTHRLYSNALKIYDKKNQLQAELQFYTQSFLGWIDYRLNQFQDQLRPPAQEEKDNQEKELRQQSAIDLFVA